MEILGFHFVLAAFPTIVSKSKLQKAISPSALAELTAAWWSLTFGNDITLFLGTQQTSVLMYGHLQLSDQGNSGG